MSTIEDKLLDGPRVHYCDVDSDHIRLEDRSDEDDNDSRDDKSCMSKGGVSSLFTRPDDDEEQSNYPRRVCNSTNTGPKGVLEDYRKKSLPSQESSQVCNSSDDLEAEFRELMNDDSILQRIAEKRLAQLRRSGPQPTFGFVQRLKTGDELLEALDREHPNVLIIVYIYTSYSKICSKVNKFMDQLADSYKDIKIVTLNANVTQLSDNFKRNGVPALLAYRNGDLIKSLVQMEESLDKDFDFAQVRELLVDNGIIDS